MREGVKEAGDVTDNAPLRSGKGSLYEGGTRVPFIARCPGVILPGSVLRCSSIHVDVFPTLLEVASAKKISDQPLDGTSLVPAFRDPTASLARDAIYQHFPGYLGAGRTRGGPPGRFDPTGRLEVDGVLRGSSSGTLQLARGYWRIQELGRFPSEKKKELHDKMIAWRTAIGAPMPTPNQRPSRAPRNPKEETQGLAIGASWLRKPKTVLAIFIEELQYVEEEPLAALIRLSPH